ncbi:Probable inactive receptor kinase At5g58300 [Linum grandiflorum]
MTKLSGGDANFTTHDLGWNVTSDPCQSTQSSWRGVGCDDNQSVTSIILSGFRFSGTLDPELLCSAAKSLTVLWLENNTISGQIPESIATCTSLKILDLYNNSLSGPIPDSIVQLSNLTGFVISYNKVSGLIPDFDTAVMERLNVSNNNLTGAIPEGLGGKFDANRFTGNPSLCGKPLENSCTASGPEASPNQGEANGSCRVTIKKWVLMGLTMGFSFLLFGCVH